MGAYNFGLTGQNIVRKEESRLLWMLVFVWQFLSERLTPGQNEHFWWNEWLRMLPAFGSRPYTNNSNLSATVTPLNLTQQPPTVSLQTKRAKGTPHSPGFGRGWVHYGGLALSGLWGFHASRSSRPSPIPGCGQSECLLWEWLQGHLPAGELWFSTEAEAILVPVLFI